MKNLGTLFMLDGDRDGRFGVEDVQRFAKMIRGCEIRDVKDSVTSVCLMKMWEEIVGEESGEDDFIAWIGKLVYEN